MVDESKDIVTVSLPVAGVLTAAEIERKTVEALEERVNDAGCAWHQRSEKTREAVGSVAGALKFDRTSWLAVVTDLHDLAQACTRAAVAISTSLAARDALIQQNTTRAPESALEREA